VQENRHPSPRPYGVDANRGVSTGVEGRRDLERTSRLTAASELRSGAKEFSLGSRARSGAIGTLSGSVTIAGLVGLAGGRILQTESPVGRRLIRLSPSQAVIVACSIREY
jgi:hypothetical protein